jgi:hypothetical protein
MAVLSKPKIIGTVACDSGTIAITDPSYLEVSKEDTVRLPQWNLFTSFDTEVGDGEFVVYAQRDSLGKLRRIIIEI